MEFHTLKEMKNTIKLKEMKDLRGSRGLLQPDYYNLPGLIEMNEMFWKEMKETALSSTSKEIKEIHFFQSLAQHIIVGFVLRSLFWCYKNIYQKLISQSIRAAYSNLFLFLFSE
jgi:hypothetical protein